MSDVHPALTLPASLYQQITARTYRQEPCLGPPTAEQTIHLEAAHQLNTGPMPRVEGEGRLGGAVDAVAFRVLRRLFSGIHRGELEDTDYYELEGGWLQRSERSGRELASYFQTPTVPEVHVAKRGRLPDGGVVEDLSFPSAGYAPHRPAARRLLRHYPTNAVAQARCYRHPEAGHPALLWLHGWGMGFPRVEALVSRARWLYARLGLDVYLYVLPYHGARRPPGVTFAGQVFPTTHMTRTNEAFLQAVWECRSLMAWHRERSGSPCGVAGLSLGGYLCAVLASVAPETAFAVCLLPVADIPSLMWSNGEGTHERQWAEQSGVTFEMFCRSMAVHAPLARDLVIPHQRVLLVGARGDRIIPPRHTEVLWEHWHRPQIHWIPGSHLVHFGRQEYLGRMDVFLDGLGMVHRP